MKNISKLRIIHSHESNPEKEYLTTFFQYIGLVTHDELIVLDDKHNYEFCFNEHFSQFNSYDGIDIVLNYYGEDYSLITNNRIYLYFDLERKICKILPKPLTSFSHLSLKENSNVSKRDIRREVLGFLINEIWKNDELNRLSIQQIKDCYIPENDDKDLFYILQAEFCCNSVFNSGLLKNTNEKITSHDEKIPLELYLNNNFEITMFIELWRMYNSIQDNTPYSIYTRINTLKILLSLYTFCNNMVKNDLHKIKYNNQNLKLCSYDDLLNQLNNMLQEYPWFIGAYLVVIELNEIVGCKNNELNYFLANIDKSVFPAYYSSVFCTMGKKCLSESTYSGSEYWKEQAEKYYKIAMQINSNDYNARYMLGTMKGQKGYFNEARNILSLFSNAVKVIYAEENDNLKNNIKLLSPKELILYFQAHIILAKIEINNGNEYLAKHRISAAFLILLEFENNCLIEKISDEKEKIYQNFIQYHKFSPPVLDLYIFLRPWVEDIVNDKVAQNIMQKKITNL